MLDFDVLTKQLQKKLEGKYEFIFINGPVARTPINTCTEEPITYDWFVRKKDAANFFDSIMFDLDLLLPYINQYWDQDFVGLWGFSMGAHTSTLIARHLAPLPEFVWLMGLSPIPPSAKLSGYDPMIDHLSGFRVLSLMGDADNGKDVFINYKKSYETMWYKGAHDYCSDPDAYDRLCAWLEPVPNYDYTIDSYNIELFLSNNFSYKAVAQIGQEYI
ncbi:hypothetical protein HK103_002583 [Boothiomyces macroporosus]|uniref:Serine hydrolase domain-containing protein n=1 Tax=Boothiomyces macroporosus TaxID=261099 RepID=A0AAD5UCW4_9FUNG|nr:hypothetical protein HK103_002583 [Boothiomyces macroporosus]